MPPGREYLEPTPGPRYGPAREVSGRGILRARGGHRGHNCSDGDRRCLGRVRFVVEASLETSAGRGDRTYTQVSAGGYNAHGQKT